MTLAQYIEESILPRYASFDAAHREDHALSVMSRSLSMARHYDVNLQMVVAIAAMHDIGLCEGREHHHEASARMILADTNLRQWFTEEQIRVMAEAAEDHRASSRQAPRSIYGRIVAEADRLIEPRTVLTRTLQYGLSHYPELNRQQHLDRAVQHLKEKYAEGGYLRLWLPESPNAAPLRELRALIANGPRLMATLANLYDALTATP